MATFFAAIKWRCTLTESSVSNRVHIRSAEEGDFEWVAGLMEQALSPFYGGDHRAHARRIFDTHIQGGVDLVGHFSAGQHMFIAEVNGNRAGLVHVVDKKQGTVKMSPLIVDSRYRKGYGVGKALLAYAERYAVDAGVRQVYGTVAVANVEALGFFLRNGYRITGTAKDHYLIGADEHMIYKQIGEDSGIDAPNVSVVPFNEERHGDQVRQLILGTMKGDFDGVDDEWVDALYAGYRRRNSGDVNVKFKIVYVAECGGEVVGVAGATPKKGDPIKLMPLMATNEAAFEALIVDLRGLLVEYGHKLYMHLVPEAWQVLCLQRHGWSLEGVFAGGYSSDSIVQQWGHNMNTGGNIVRHMRIKGPYYDYIMEGVKTLEVRVGYDSIKRYRVGELIELSTRQHTGRVRIRAIRTYANFDVALAVEPWQKIIPDATSKAEATRRLREIYNPEKEAYGVYVFEIEPVR